MNLPLTRPYVERTDNGCTRHAFDGCNGNGDATCRNCPQRIMPTAPRGCTLRAVLTVLVLSIVFGTCAYVGLSRAEAAYQESLRS